MKKSYQKPAISSRKSTQRKTLATMANDENAILRKSVRELDDQQFNEEFKRGWAAACDFVIEMRKGQ